MRYEFIHLKKYEKTNIKIIDELIYSLEATINNEKNLAICHNNDDDEFIIDNENINSDDSEEFSEEYLIDEKEKEKFFDNLSLEVNYDNDDDSLKEDNLNDDDILTDEVNKSLYKSNNNLENDKREEVNIEEVLKDRGVLNIFTLNKENYKSDLKEILLKNEKDLREFRKKFRKFGHSKKQKEKYTK